MGRYGTSPLRVLQPHTEDERATHSWHLVPLNMTPSVSENLNKQISSSRSKEGQTNPEYSLEVMMLKLSEGKRKRRRQWMR